jgi:hypothetical protein
MTKRKRKKRRKKKGKQKRKEKKETDSNTIFGMVSFSLIPSNFPSLNLSSPSPLPAPSPSALLFILPPIGRPRLRKEEGLRKWRRPEEEKEQKHEQEEEEEEGACEGTELGRGRG